MTENDSEGSITVTVVHSWSGEEWAAIAARAQQKQTANVPPQAKVQRSTATASLDVKVELSSAPPAPTSVPSHAHHVKPVSPHEMQSRHVQDSAGPCENLGQYCTGPRFTQCHHARTPSWTPPLDEHYASAHVDADGNHHAEFTVGPA